MKFVTFPTFEHLLHVDVRGCSKGPRVQVLIEGWRVMEHRKEVVYVPDIPVR